jgi:hypothetical protein
MEPIFTDVMKGESLATEDSLVSVDRKGYKEVLPAECRVLTVGDVPYMVYLQTGPSNSLGRMRLGEGKMVPSLDF